MANAKRTFLVTTMIVALMALVATLEVKRQVVEAQLTDLNSQIDKGDITVEDVKSNQELADKIIDQVRKLIDIPEDVNPTVATIVDVNALRTQNPFYNKAENGDHLVVTPERAILYRAAENKIIDVVPVQLEPAEAPEQEGGSEEG